MASTVRKCNDSKRCPRAVEQLRMVATELEITPVRNAVHTGMVELAPAVATLRYSRRNLRRVVWQWAAGAIDQREMAWTSLAHRTYAAQANCPVEAAVRKEAADRAVALGRLAMHLNGARECQMDLRLSLLGCMASCDGVHAVIATGVFDVRVAEGAHP